MVTGPWQRHDSPVAGLSGDARNEGAARTFRHEFPDRGDGAEFDGNARSHAILCEACLEHLPIDTSPFGHQEGFVVQVFGACRDLPGEPVAGRQCHDEFFFGHHFVFEFRHIGRFAESEGNIECPALQSTAQLAAAGALQLQPQRWVLGAEMRQECGQIAGAQRFQSADGQRACCHVCRRRHCRLRFLCAGQKLLGVVEQPLPCLGQFQFASSAVEKRCIQICFQRLHLFAHARLGKVDALSGPRDVEVGSNGDERFQMSELHDLSMVFLGQKMGAQDASANSARLSRWLFRTGATVTVAIPEMAIMRSRSALSAARSRALTVKITSIGPET